MIVALTSSARCMVNCIVHSSLVRGCSLLHSPSRQDYRRSKSATERDNLCDRPPKGKESEKSSALIPGSKKQSLTFPTCRHVPKSGVRACASMNAYGRRCWYQRRPHHCSWNSKLLLVHHPVITRHVSEGPSCGYCSLSAFKAATRSFGVRLAAITSRLPPAWTIFSLADSLIRVTVNLSFFVSSPSPRILTSSQRTLTSPFSRNVVALHEYSHNNNKCEINYSVHPSPQCLSDSTCKTRIST